MIVETEHPIFGSVKGVRTSTHVGDSRNHDHKRAPFLNENKDYVLNDLLNYKTDKIKGLEDGGAFG